MNNVLPTENTDTINGFKVIASFDALHTGARIVIVNRPDADTPYVTAFHWRGSNEWGLGHYFVKFVDARDDFFERVRCEGAPLADS